MGTQLVLLYEREKLLDSGVREFGSGRVIVQQEKAGGTARQTEYDVVVIFDKDVRGLWITTRNGEYFEPFPKQRLGGLCHFNP